ncbi:MAG: hypothetical protein AAB907_02215 [Patescibacteria group bacterium]
MNTPQTTQQQIKVSVSPGLKSLVKSRAQNIGVPITQYVKNLIINDVKQYPVYQVDEETEKGIGQSLKDLAEGRYTVIRGTKELDAHLNSL